MGLGWVRHRGEMEANGGRKRESTRAADRWVAAWEEAFTIRTKLCPPKGARKSRLLKFQSKIEELRCDR